MASKSAMEAARLLCVQEDLSDDRVSDISHTLESYANDRAKAVFEATREKAAKICDDLHDEHKRRSTFAHAVACRDCAAEVRALTFADVAGEE